MRCITASQSSPPAGGESIEIIFSGGVYVGENTAQSASVRIACSRRTIRARSGLRALCQKAQWAFRQRAAEGNLSGSVCPIMPRRVRRPQAANEVRSFSPAACTSEKIPLSPPVCELSALGGRFVRAADCKPFAGKARRGFPAVEPVQWIAVRAFLCALGLVTII